jgi:hypothetical protein
MKVKVLKEGTDDKDASNNLGIKPETTEVVQGRMDWALN